MPIIIVVHYRRCPLIIDSISRCASSIVDLCFDYHYLVLVVILWKGVAKIGGQKGSFERK